MKNTRLTTTPPLLPSSPCVHSTRLRVYVQNVPVYGGRYHAHMLKHVCAWCRYTRGRLERTHGDVLSGHTGFFRVSHHTTPHTHHDAPQQPPPPHNTLGQRQRREDKTRQDEREDGRQDEREEKTREKRRQDEREEKMNDKTMEDEREDERQ